MNVFEIESPSPAAARRIARNLYVSIRAEHGWGERFEPEPSDDLLDLLAELAPRDMRRALMTGFGNARLHERCEISAGDLPKQGATKGKLGFLQ
jgi:ATP-dependent Lon protease